MLLATTNKGKLQEAMALLDGLSFELVGLDENASTVEVETGSTFSENALLKARHYHELSGLPALADDSGLEVDALKGAPGVHSARYGGPDATDATRIFKLLDELKQVPAEARTARFVCSVAIVWRGGERVFTGEARGRILDGPRGESGFGYDPVFLYDPLGRTFAELSVAEKANVSHRGHAFHEVARWLRQQPGVLDTIASGDRIADPTTQTSASVDKR